MPDTAGFAAAVTVRDSALRAAVQTAYANGDDSGKKFDRDLSGGGIGMVPDLFLGQFDVHCEGTSGLLVITLPMWGQVTTTLNGSTTVVEMNGVMQLTISPVLEKGVDPANPTTAIVLATTSDLATRSWSGTVTSAGTPANVAALFTGTEFRDRFGNTFRQGVQLGLIKLPSIDGSFLGALVPASTRILGKVREGALLIGLNCVDDTHNLAGDPEALQDFAGGNDVAGMVHPDAVDIMVSQVQSKLLDGVAAAGATLSNFLVRAKNGFFLVSGTATKSDNALNFSFHLTPSMFHTRPAAAFVYLPKPRHANGRTWAALEFSISDLQTDVDRPWWEVLFGEVIFGILTLGFSTLTIEGLIDTAVWTFEGKVKNAKLGGPAPRIQHIVPPAGGIATRIALEHFDVTESGVFVGVSVRTTPSPAKLRGPKTVPETYRADTLRYILEAPSGAAKNDPALHLQWTLRDLTNNTQLQQTDARPAWPLNFEFSPSSAHATDFRVTARLYRQLGAAVTELTTKSVDLHMRAALPPQTYTRWNWQGTNPQIGIDGTTGNWDYRGERRVDRWSVWHRTDAPCRSVNAWARYRYNPVNADRLSFSLRYLEDHKDRLCPYCFFGGPAGANASL